MELEQKPRAHMEPIILMYEVEESGKLVKKTAKLMPGETIQLPDDIAYGLLGTVLYRGALQLVNAQTEKKLDEYANKSLKGSAAK
jgi:hypothetical protein